MHARLLEILDAEIMHWGVTICPIAITYSIRFTSSWVGKMIACFLVGVGFKMREYDEDGWLDMFRQGTNVRNRTDEIPRRGLNYTLNTYAAGSNTKVDAAPGNSLNTLITKDRS